MLDTEYETNSRAAEQAARSRKLFSAIVLAALDDFIHDKDCKGKPAMLKECAVWANSNYGQGILSCAGIEVGDRATAGLVAFVERGVKTTHALAELSNAD